MTEPERRRRRPAVSCSLCRRRKLRCDRKTPCSSCVRSKNESCVYENHPSQVPRQRLGQDQTTNFSLVLKPRESIPVDRASNTSRGSTVPSQPSNSLGTSSTSTWAPPSQLSGWDVEYMKSRIRQLEEQLSKTTQKPTESPASTLNSDIETSTSHLGGTLHFHRESSLFGQPQAITRCVTHKTRLFGQSHWISGAAPLLKDLFRIIEPHPPGEISKAFSGIQKCKSLAKVIKSQRAPPWPSPPTTDLPQRDVADKLVDCYLRTTETVYRILHIPSFKKNYEALWVSDTEPDTAFLVQLKLVLAIGATTYDEQFSLRASAVRWVYEAQTWISEPIFKKRLGIKFLQTNLLLLLARESTSISEDSVWVSVGALLRRAVTMGLHRDPARLPERSAFAAEMHRRLWNTIVEVALQSSLTSGAPPLISLDDFDTEPPRNLDDEQLMNEDSVPKPEEYFTQSSIAIALRKTFPLRLAVTKFLNGLGSHGTYEETLRLDTELRASYKALCRTLQGYNSSTGPSPSQFEIHAVDFLMHRYRSSLHVPFFERALHETAFAFTRKVVVETSLKIWCTAYPATSIMAVQSRSDMAPSDRPEFLRLVACSSGFYRSVAMQAAILIAIELRTQLQEEEGLGSVPLRPDLLSVLDDAKTWCLRSIEAGETNIKGYLLVCIVSAHVQGLMQGLGKDEIRGFLVKVMEDAVETCLPILEKMVAQGQVDGGVEGLHHVASNMPPEVTRDWDLMMPDALFNPDNMEPMSWMFNDETMQGALFW